MDTTSPPQVFAADDLACTAAPRTSDFTVAAAATQIKKIVTNNNCSSIFT
jgi:hypothetical protein